MQEVGKVKDDVKVLDSFITVEELSQMPLSAETLRARLKHIAGLCWGLSIDLQNSVELYGNLIKENERLQNENNGLYEEIRGLNNKVYHREYKHKRSNKQ